MLNLYEYNQQIEKKVRFVIEEIGGELWIDTKTGVSCPKCKTELRVLYPRLNNRGYLPQVVVRCPKCRFEGSMFILHQIKCLEDIHFFFPECNKKEAKKIHKKLSDLLEKQRKMVKGSRIIVKDI